MSKELLERLESVTQRLERVARKMGGGGGDEGGVPEYVTDYDRFMSTEVAQLISATEAMKFPEDISGLVKNGLNNIQSLIRRLPNSKKPQPNDLMAFLKGASGAINEIDRIKYRGKNFKKFGDHYKAMFEFINQLQWVTQDSSMGQLPGKHCQTQSEAVDFNLNRVLKNNKDDCTKNWMKALKAASKKQTEYVNEYFKTGLTWNPKGTDLSSSSESKSTSTSKSTSSNNTNKTSKPKKEGDTAQLFGQLNRGNIGAKGFGLKKVRDDQKSKNRKDRTGVVKMKQPVKKQGRKKGNPAMTKRGFRLTVENYNEGVFEVQQADLKSNVYVTMCDESVIQIKKKVKSVTVDNCVKCRIFVTDVVSTVELINCKSVKIICQGVVPSLAVDKSMSPTIILTRKAYENPPNIFTSNISAMNISLPGKTDKDDNIELPIPEQFCTTIDNKKGTITTTDVKHG